MRAGVPLGTAFGLRTEVNFSSFGASVIDGATEITPLTKILTVTPRAAGARSAIDVRVREDSSVAVAKAYGRLPPACSPGESGSARRPTLRPLPLPPQGR